ncbi:hypothetical protein IWQ60_010791 [Tieghemiomyces parasiticus]|uniref:Fungal lipase-type domain-containing protein n=1 Tax=Tieghemiomyces parasiticus TaxID=78921 RepID=A0A9W8DN31_9FUNG|nr:hypothetical protein IWQ60_010791 [Tieghemiomyces parasiticus]
MQVFVLGTLVARLILASPTPLSSAIGDLVDKGIAKSHLADVVGTDVPDSAKTYTVVNSKQIEFLKGWVDYAFASYRINSMADDKVLAKSAFAKHATLEYVATLDTFPALTVFIAVDRPASMIVVTFRGSDDETLYNTASRVNLVSLIAPGIGRVFGGAMQGVTKQGPTIVAKHRELLQKYPGFRTYVVGHSLGGLHAVFYSALNAKAILASAKTSDAGDATTKPENKATTADNHIPWQVITFACPMEGDKDFSEYYRGLNIPTFSVMNSFDPISYLPTEMLKYTRAVPRIVVDNHTNQTVQCHSTLTNLLARDLCTGRPELGSLSKEYHSAFWGNDGSHLGAKPNAI